MPAKKRNKLASGVKRKPRGKPFAPGNTIGNRFQPGQSGNPSGGPKRKPISDAFLAYLAAANKGELANVFKHLPFGLSKLLRGTMNQVNKGNSRSLEIVLERTEGKVTTPIALDLGEKLVERIALGHKRAQERKAKQNG